MVIYIKKQVCNLTCHILNPFRLTNIMTPISEFQLPMFFIGKKFLALN